MNILVTGGAGYIGSHMVYALIDKGYNVHVVDNLSHGNLSILPKGIKFTNCDIGNQEKINRIIFENKFDAVAHFAASVVVSESMKNPIHYYLNNVAKTILFIEMCIKNNIRNFIFSSTAAVYKSINDLPIKEKNLKEPSSTYGMTKLMIEEVFENLRLAHNLNIGVLRYFNVAGADPKKRTGQINKSATHLIKVACETALGKRPHIDIYGDNYNTTDGTCIRDYIHVSDLISAHILLLEKLVANKSSFTFNCGYGKGYSVLEVIKTIKEISGFDFKVNISNRRDGDPPVLIADSSELKNVLQWTPRFNSLNKIISDAFAWEKFLLKKNF